MVPDHSHYLHTQQLTQDCLELIQSSHSLRWLSTKRLGGGATLGRPTGRSSFLGHLRKPFFPVHGMRIKQFKTFQSFQSLTLAAASSKTFQPFQASRQFKVQRSMTRPRQTVPGFRVFLKGRNEQQDLIFFFVKKKEHT